MDQPGPTTKPYALVVDDNPVIVMHAADILEDAGFMALTAYSTESAIPVLKLHGEAIVLLFTDVDMPGPQNGFALARITAERWPSIGILVASGACQPKPGDLPDGAMFIGKPFSAQIIYDRVHKILPDRSKPSAMPS